MENDQLLSKIATSDKHGENSPYFDGWKAYDMNPFHPTKNPEGVIQMGLAENQLCFDLTEEWIKKNPKASICTGEGVVRFKEIANFQNYHGLPEFNQAVAKLMERIRGGRVRFDPERIVMSGGATGANEQLMFCLANPGDAFLLPSPYYPAFVRDLGWRTGVQIVPVDCDSSNNFQVTRKSLEAAYKKAKEDGINIKGLIITNPSNPLGTTLDKETLKSLVNFVNDKRIHLVSDEIYSATVFKGPRFVSISEVVQEMGDCNMNLIHVVYSMSKDFGFPGFRVGIVYSYNDEVVRCCRRMSSFGLVSSQTQHLLASMLSDEGFVGELLGETARRLERRHDTFTKSLKQAGINCLKSNAGLYVWMDLRHLLKEPTFEAESTLWKVILDEVKLNVSPGSSFRCVEPGWFRVCFANMDDETVQVALRRIQAFVLQEKEKDPLDDDHQPKKPTKAKFNWKQKNLRLSFSSLRYEEGFISPHVMSPNSPIRPQSPLVRART